MLQEMKMAPNDSISIVPAYTLILRRVLRFHIRADLLRPNGQVDALRLKPVARLSGGEYATLGHVFEMKRPQ